MPPLGRCSADGALAERLHTTDQQRSARFRGRLELGHGHAAGTAARARAQGVLHAARSGRMGAEIRRAKSRAPSPTRAPVSAGPARTTPFIESLARVRLPHVARPSSQTLRTVAFHRSHPRPKTSSVGGSNGSGGSRTPKTLDFRIGAWRSSRRVRRCCRTAITATIKLFRPGMRSSFTLR